MASKPSQNVVSACEIVHPPLGLLGSAYQRFASFKLRFTLAQTYERLIVP